MLPSWGRVIFLWNGKIWLWGLIREGNMEEVIGQNIPWGTEESLAEDDYFQWWKWAWAQRPRGLKQGMERQGPSLSDHSGKCVCACVYTCECACTYVSLCTFLCAVLICVSFVCMFVHMCMYACTVRKSSGKYSVGGIGRCLFALSLEWIETGKFVNGCD